MNNRSKQRYTYNVNTLKSGYEAMGRINLNFAKEAMTVDNGEIVSYEEILLSNTVVKEFSDLGRDDFDD